MTADKMIDIDRDTPDGITRSEQRGSTPLPRMGGDLTAVIGMSATTTGSEKTYEFRRGEDETIVRAVADSREKAADMIVAKKGGDVREWGYVKEYDTDTLPDDGVHVVGHPFEDGDRISPTPNADRRFRIEMTVRLTGDRVRFTEETAPYGVRTFADSDFKTPNASSRPERTLENLFQSGWRRVD